MASKNPYASFLESVSKPARYIGGEHFLIKKDWETAVGRAALCFPDTYEIGMSHLGMKILYDEINTHEGLIGERCFCPWTDMEEEMRKRDLPLVTLESFTPLSEFHVVGFSLQYEMSYTNILNMLDLGGISIWQKDRTEDEPFVISGGPCATHPEPIAPFMDFVVIGDGEKLFARIVHFIGEARGNGWKRQKILEELGGWKGIYVPSFYDTEIDDLSGLEVVSGVKGEFLGVVPDVVQRFFVDNLVDYPFPTRSPIPHLTAIFDRFSVELSRGCTEGCRFCQAGMIYRPVRERRPDKVIEMVMDGLKSGGYEDASLTCLSTADYSAVTPLILDLLDKLQDEDATLGISSLRAYGLDNRILDKLAEVKNTSLTFAPEAGSQRMRDVINKNISEENLMQTAEDVFSRGWKKMKLYFMIGLPTEDDEDVQAIMEVGKKAKAIAKYKCGVPGADITISASSFVPKPHTPFQWASMITLPEIERKQNLLFGLSKKYKLNFRKHVAKISYLEGIVSRGDRRVAGIIFDAWTRGARFDGWRETFDYNLWIECVEKSGIDVNYMLGTIPMKGRLPWDHIDVGLEAKFLEREWLKATHNRLSPPCGKVHRHIVHHSDLESLEKTFDIDKKRLVCYSCGVECDLKGMVEERRDFLTSMNALKNVEYVRPEAPKSIVERREKRGQNVGYTYRVNFSKIGSLSFISHLDLQKVLQRIFKRAEIKALLSEGYNARPLISFGPALTLGISSLNEFFDIRVPESWDGEYENILLKLQNNSEKGLLFNSIKEIDRRTTSIQLSAKHFVYFIPCEKIEDSNKIVEHFNNHEAITVKSFLKKNRSYIDKDIKPLIKSMHVGRLDLSKDVMETIDEVSPCIDKDGIFIKTNLFQGATVRPMEILQFIENVGVKPHRPIKVEIELLD
jgi:radical SAM family uncharacterized protein/radical SAM-linked protein